MEGIKIKMSDDTQNHWHLKKELNATHLLTTLMIIVSAIWWASTIENRLAIVETKYLSQEASINRLESYLIRIESKVDNIKK